jgi:2-keto-myo-inositol isomerase
MRFAINHIVAPSKSIEDFFAMATALGVSEVEIRNDLAGAPIQDGTPAERVKHAADAAGVTILTINALYPFNVWSPELERRAHALADYALGCAAGALVLCPLNDGNQVAFGDVVAALERLAPILGGRGLTGLVEPLGFPISSLRTKSDAVRAIDESGAENLRLVHDTFHHHLAGDPELYPGRTGLVHISGVVDRGIGVDEMLDEHRVLVDDADRLGNLAQIVQLLEAGYDGPFSFEPFSAEVQSLDDHGVALRASIDFVRRGVAGS